jgi:hypothetical protein
VTQKTYPAMFVGTFLAVALLFSGPFAGVSSAQTNLSVFQKEGASAAQQSEDRSECHLRAMQEVGYSPAAVDAANPPDPYYNSTFKDRKYQKEEVKVEKWKLKTEYNRAVQACLEKRGYKLNETAAETPPPERP